MTKSAPGLSTCSDKEVQIIQDFDRLPDDKLMSTEELVTKHGILQIAFLALLYNKTNLINALAMVYND